MTFSEWFIEMCAKHGTNPSNVAKAVGCTAPSGTGWANGSIPRKVTIKKIEDHFGEKYENKKSPTSEDAELDEIKIKIINALSSLSLEDERQILSYIQGFAAARKE